VSDSSGESHRQISDLLALVQELNGRAASSESVADLFSSAFHTLFKCIAFDVAVAVMLEQHLDLYAVTGAGGEELLSERLIARIRETLQKVIPVSLVTTEVMVKLETHDLPPLADSNHDLPFATHALLTQDRRPAGVLLLYRGNETFDDDQRQILEIFSAQVSMLLNALQAREKILNLAETDDLTGIWNKRAFRRQLPQEVERSRVYGVPLSLLIFDVDEFKQINDNFGHTIGDVVLSELCGTVREMLRPPDLFARFGGDEFAIILPHTDLGGACAVADRILSKVRTLVIPTDEEGAIAPSISIGVAEYTSDDAAAADLVRRADERLYASKRQGKNRYTA
jgi:diguanylate cyclase (GGDEF)-like protein